MNYAGILAGGRGTRFGATERPKQFLRLGSASKPVIIYTVEAFLACSAIDRIIIATPSDWLEYTRVLIAENFEQTALERIDVIEGGAQRSASLENICKFIENEFGISHEDVLVSHDAVRPFVSQRVIEENVQRAREEGCVDTVVPATDTIVVSTDAKIIDSIPPRSEYYQGQTPQSFFIDEYLRLYRELDDEQRGSLTDACKVYLMHGKRVALVMGDYDNIKITTPHGVHVAAKILDDTKGCMP